jgi:cell division protein FtsW (lipid II flippase)
MKKRLIFVVLILMVFGFVMVTFAKESDHAKGITSVAEDANKCATAMISEASEEVYYG